MLRQHMHVSLASEASWGGIAKMLQIAIALVTLLWLQQES